MTPREAKQLLENPVMKAFADGKTVQEEGVPTHEGGTPWNDVTTNYIDADHLAEHPGKYRIKPEPREFWLNVYKGGTGGAYNTKEEADGGAGRSRTECIHVREVL